jgi:isoleucyl-tRNA synthetase
MDFRETLNLPDPAFTIPMKADLGLREPEIQKSWDDQRIYHRIQESRKDAPTFVLHDGPPYTNSPIHIGTALNKLLKDFVVKTRTLMGYRAPYVPGYDNHGLPIEQTVMRAFHEKKETPDVVTLRKACREHAAKYIDIQTQQFKRLGIFGLWERPYATMEFKYEAEIIRIFKKMVENGYVYKGLRPTLWSPTSRTALADTEIVYVENFVSKSIYVRFPLLSFPNGWAKSFDNLYAIIWTTTPWTIPANLAVAFHPNFEYFVVKSGDAHYLVLKELSDKVRDAIGAEEWTVVADFLGISFEGTKFKHPLFDRESVAVMAEYLTTEDGTGIVHTAPGHGRDDFYTGIKNDLPILCPVDERGMMTDEAGEFAGISYRDCNDRVVERLEEVGNLLSVSDYLHSYPHAERDGKPVIFRATEQWFVGIDTNDLRQQMLSKIKNKSLDKLDDGTEGVVWLPANGYNRIDSMIRNRPDWCISRQRPWGVGIPILYGAKSGKPIMDPAVIELIAQKVESEGSDVWFEKDASYFVPNGFSHPETGETEFRKETDVLDVWFDSGCTNLCVIDGAVEPQWKEKWPADLYLEGSDQHRGWFNTSLIIGTAIKGEPPYKTVLTHGFVDDEKGEKMSKRSGNSIDPVTACDTYGADILRLWVASVDWTNDAPCGPNLLAQMGDSYRRIRNTLRFLLSNLSDYPTQGDLPTTDGKRFNWNATVADIVQNDDVWATEHDLLPLDQWVIEQTDLLIEDCMRAYGEYDFGAAISAIHNFCADQLSSFYLDAIKDRMYCDGTVWNTRRSGQMACHTVLVKLTKLVAPILAHTAEEVWKRIPGMINEPDSVHITQISRPTSIRLEGIQDGDLQRRIAAVLEWRAFAFAQFEPWKAANNAKDSQDFVVTLTLPAAQKLILDSLKGELAILFKFSDVVVVEGKDAATFEASKFEKCERSRIRRKDVELLNEHWLSARDRRAIGWK